VEFQRSGLKSERELFQLPSNIEVDISCSFRGMSRTMFKVKNKQRAITPKLGKAELRFLYTARLLNEIYLHPKTMTSSSWS